MHQNATRPIGVTIPEGQRSGEEIPDQDLPTLSVHNFSKLETWAGRYVDKSGKLTRPSEGWKISAVESSVNQTPAI